MNSDRKTELLVGLFLFVGLLLSGLVVIKFGKVRDYFQGTYMKRVRFDDATGIRIGSPVALGGQRVGKVKTPVVVEGKSTFNKAPRHQVKSNDWRKPAAAFNLTNYI